MVQKTQTAPTPPPATNAPQAPVAPGALPPANADLQTLQNALGELRVQQAGLNAQWNALRRQLDNMLQNNPARPGVQQQWANVGVQRAGVEGNIAVLDARIAQLQGRPVGMPQIPQLPRRSGPDPDMVVGMTMGLLMIIAIPLSIAYARRIWRGKPTTGAPKADEIAPRLDRLEHAVDTIAIEVERISEGQRFVTKILAERPAQAPSAGSESAFDAKPPLALGAGPMEPIRVAERQAVKQSVTPH